MIESDSQYKVTREQLSKFQDALFELATQKELNEDYPDLLFDASRDALISQIKELREQMEAYELSMFVFEDKQQLNIETLPDGRSVPKETEIKTGNGAIWYRYTVPSEVIWDY